MEIGDVSKISLVYIWIMQKLVLPSSHSGNNSRQSAENQGNTPPSAAELETGARLQLCDCGHVVRVLSQRRSFVENTSHICLRSRPVTPMLFVRPRDQVTKCKWPSDQVTEWLGDRKLRRQLTVWYVYVREHTNKS